MSSPPQTHCLTAGDRALLAAELLAARSSSAEAADVGPCLVRVHPPGPGLADHYPLGAAVVVGRVAGPGVGVVLLAANGVVYVIYGIESGHFRRKLLPISPRAVIADVRDALRGRLAHEDLSVYNAAQRAAYLALILALMLLVFSGLAIWKPVQLQELAALMGGYEGARLVHFFAMALMVFIALVHIVMVILVPRTFPTIITGRARRMS